MTVKVKAVSKYITAARVKRELFQQKIVGASIPLTEEVIKMLLAIRKNVRQGFIRNYIMTKVKHNKVYKEQDCSIFKALEYKKEKTDNIDLLLHYTFVRNLF